MSELPLEEYDSILDNIRDDLMRLRKLDRHQAVDLMEAYYECVGDPADGEAKDILDRYVGQFESVTEFGQFHADYTGLLEGVDDSIERYFNYGQYATDLLNEGTYSISDYGHVFINY
ncbi:MAG: antirestriction protein ArdA [bacterium]